MINPPSASAPHGQADSRDRIGQSDILAENLRPVGSSGFWVRFLKRGKRYLLPLVLLDCIVVYYFAMHLSLAKAADGMVAAMGQFHSLDPRVDQLVDDAQALLGKSIFALLVAAGGASLCVAAFAGLCWSARCLRKRKRLAAELDATLWLEGTPNPVRVVDISDSGCRISAGLALAPGSCVRLSFGGTLETSAKVVWGTNGYAGLQFASPLGQQAASPGGEPMPRLWASDQTPAADLQNLKGCRSTGPASAWRTI
jgi:hypothetical protein